MSVDKRELQGLVGSAYPRSPAARYLVCGVEDAAEARASLRELAGRVTFGSDVAEQIRTRNQPGQSPSVNIAFSSAGLAALGVAADRTSDFSREFHEGMVTPHRQRALGDLDGSPSDPAQWLWGGPNNPRVHVVVLLFAEDEDGLKALTDDVASTLTGMRVLRTLDTVSIEGGHEHFGFLDGIGSPWVDGLHKPRGEDDEIAVGEILLGHPAQTGAPEPFPTLGRNGSYLVMRQLVQDVEGFWAGLRGTVGDDRAAHWAAKMNGRWLDGTPLVVSPDRPTGDDDPADDFGYRYDREGVSCPLGAHIRRTNPRDSVVAKAQDSIDIVKRHRLLRRGRPFGPAAPRDSWPDGVPPVKVHMGQPDESGKRGLFFMCLGTNLARQFEFVMQTWLNNPKFGGLFDETDAFVGEPSRMAEDANGFIFTAPGPVINHRIELPEKYVYCIGGAYLFLPGRTGLEAITAS